MRLRGFPAGQCEQTSVDIAKTTVAEINEQSLTDSNVPQGATPQTEAVMLSIRANAHHHRNMCIFRLSFVEKKHSDVEIH